MTFTIEPMINQGDWDVVTDQVEGWTVPPLINPIIFLVFGFSLFANSFVSDSIDTLMTISGFFRSCATV